MSHFKAAIALFVTAIFLVVLPSSKSQVFRVQGGASTLLNAEGGSVEFKAPNYTGNFGIGFYNGGIQFGAVARSQIDGYTVTAGDDSIPFNLPTDWFDGTHYFLARGVGLSHLGANGGFRLFAGSSSTGFSTGFFQAARSDDPTALLFFDRRVTPHLWFISRNVVSKSQSSLQAIRWRPDKWLEVSMSAGFGSNQPYAAAGFNIETDRLSLKAGYVETGTRFRRITLVSPLASEVQKGNIEVAYQPNQTLTINAGHHNILEPRTPDAPFIPASVNELGANFHIGRTYFGSGYFQSSVESRSTTGVNLYTGRRITNNVDVTANYFSSRPQNGIRTNIASATVRETLTKRISVLQLISRSEGQTSVAIGGDLLTNRFRFRADYQNVYLPYRPDRPFQQALAVNVAVRLSGPLQVTGATNVAPDGRLRYTFGVSTYLYRERGMWQSSNPESFSFPKYVVVGVVQDSNGTPVEGAAIHLGNQVVYSTDSGEFLLRVRTKKDLSLTVVPNEFLTAGVFEVMKAPSSVRPKAEEVSERVEIVVRRILAKAEIKK